MAIASCDSGVVVSGKTDQVNINEFSLGTTKACIDTNLGTVVCPATDMARVTKTGAVPYEHSDYDWSNGPLQLRAARNETIAFQLLIRTTSANAETDINIKLEPATTDTNTNNIHTSWFNQSLFSAFYHPIDNAGYLWGPSTAVLPWPDEYPDALVPSYNQCNSPAQIAAPQVNLKSTVGTNQSIWVDTYVDRTTAPGTYSQNISLKIGDKTIPLPIQITVYDTTLPDKTSMNAVGELYRSYSLEGADVDITQASWRAMSQCYQQMAHRHRMVFIERLPDLLTDEQLSNYADTIEPSMTGELFSANRGYIGPGADTPVSIWRTPWPQIIDGVTYSGITQREIERYDGLANTWHELVSSRQWTDVDYFAYIFDEVDGPENNGDGSLPRDEYIALVHNQFKDVQANIDNGSQSTNIDLIWTSHSNPTVWQDDPILDLTNTVRLWSPNAHAADVDFLSQRMDEGDKAWFYHSGHPAVGAHSINASGIEMRTWGVIGVRYGFDGQLMWAVNLGSDEFPFRDPQYLADEDRAGNGVMVYPGNQLDKIGYASFPGPVPSMRLKAWRRGLQDAELYLLAKEQSPIEADALIEQQIPTALSEGSGLASWSSDSADWINFHHRLLELASPN